jgi:hypothetical protein
MWLVGSLCPSLLGNLLTYSMEQSPSWNANIFSTSQEINRILWNQKVVYCIHKCPPTISILNQLNSVHSPTSHFLKIHFYIIFPSMPGSSKLDFPWGFSIKDLYTSLPCKCYMPHPPHFSQSITCIIFGEQYRTLSYSLCNFLHSPVTSFLLDPKILFNTVFSNTLSLRTSVSASDQVSHPYKNRQNYNSLLHWNWFFFHCFCYDVKSI